MSKYLGETQLDISMPKYGMYATVDWISHWIDMYGYVGGDHHKVWLLDQIRRIIYGTPIMVSIPKRDSDYKDEVRFSLGEPTSEYLSWVKKCELEDGYAYDTGVAP